MSKVNIPEDTIMSSIRDNDPSLLGDITLSNSVQERFVAYHKQIERRMDGSSGGACGAILETLVRDGYYFCGAKFDENLHLHHVLFNEPELLASISGYKPVQSDCVAVFPQIRELLLAGNKVAFCGTSLQCYALQKYVDNSDNLLTIDFINTDFVAHELLEKYAKELSEKYGSKVVNIRFHNREFSDIASKRITLANGRVVYTHTADLFDKLAQSGRFTKTTANGEFFGNLNNRVSDFTIGSYQMKHEANDGIGYSYISVNTDKAQSITKALKKRLVIVLEGADVDESSIRYRKNSSTPDPDLSLLNKMSLQDITGTIPKGKLYRFKKTFGAIRRGFQFAQYKPDACFKFIKMNFFNDKVKTDYENNGFFYIAPNCVFKLPKEYSIELHGALKMGSRRIKDSRLETRLRMEANARILVHEGCAWGSGSNIEIYKNALLEVGDLRSNAELNIICGEHITLGSPCNIARNATVRDTSGHLIATPGYKMTKPITIGNHVWVCTGSTVMPGVTIGDGSIVGACSFVNKKIPAFTMVQGSPAEEVCPIKYFRI